MAVFGFDLEAGQFYIRLEAIDLRQIQIVEVSNDQLSKDDWHVWEIVGGRQLNGSTEDLHRKCES